MSQVNPKDAPAAFNGEDQAAGQVVCFNATPQRQIGMQLYQKNNALRNFANVMEHPEFSTFFNEYLFKDPVTVVKLMKLYATLGQTIDDPYEKLAVFNAQMIGYLRHTNNITDQ